jgi:hypothetical protein
VKTPVPIDKSDLDTNAVRVIERIEENFNPRLQGGIKSFANLWKAITIMATVILTLVGVGAYLSDVAKKSDMEAHFKVRDEETSALKAQVAVLAAQFLAVGKSLDELKTDAKHKDDVLLDIRLALGTPRVVAVDPTPAPTPARKGKTK